MPQKSLSFIITSAGKGLRFGTTKNGKQFELINDIPVLIYSLKTISKIKNKPEIILTIDKSVKIPYVQRLLRKYSLDTNITICSGGSSRAQSVFNGFKKIKRDNGYVVVHDAVRPNLNLKQIRKMIELIGNFSGIVLASKIHDTIKRIKNSKSISDTINRDGLWVSETPQIFKYAALKKCYENDKRFAQYTDESELLEKNGFKVRVFKNDGYNNKITTKKDLRIYELLLKNV